MTDILFKKEGYDLVAAAIEVHTTLGGGMAEEIYQESLEIELALRGIPFVSKPALRCSYKSRPLKKEYFPDLLVCGGLVAELKAVSKLLPEHTGQLINYLRIAGRKTGYLLNFGPVDKLEWKRFVV